MKNPFNEGTIPYQVIEALSGLEQPVSMPELALKVLGYDDASSIGSISAAFSKYEKVGGHDARSRLAPAGDLRPEGNRSEAADEHTKVENPDHLFAF